MSSEKKNSFLSIASLQTKDTFFETVDGNSFLPTCHGHRIFVKGFNIRELIGEELANFMERPSARYFLVEKDGVLQLASLPFLSESQQIVYPGDLLEDYEDAVKGSTPFDDSFRLGDAIPFFLNCCHTEEAKDIFLTNLFQTFAIDTYMRQEDRCNCNCMMYECDEGLFWAPMYDYEASFYTFDEEEEVFDYFNYDNPFFSLTLEDYRLFLERYPIFRSYLQRVQEVSLSHILTIIKERFAFSYSKEFIDYWSRQEEASQKILSRILK